MQCFRGICRKSFLLIGKIYKIRLEILLQSGYKKNGCTVPYSRSKWKKRVFGQKKSAVTEYSASEERGFIVPVYQSGNNCNGHVAIDRPGCAC